MRKVTVLYCLFAAVAVLMALTGTSLGAVEGKGWIEDPNDKVVTYFGLGLVVFFTFVVVLGSAIQSSMAKRKERKKNY